MMNSWAVSYRSSAVSTSASLSKAIRDERYEDLQEILKKVAAEKRNDPNTNNADTSKAMGSQNHHHENDNPLWEANSRGWTPMHVAAIACPTMPLEWWSWILQQQYDLSLESKWAEKRSDLWTRETDQGQTVVELFFQTALDPLPWCKHSLKEKAGRLESAIERILSEQEGRSRAQIRKDTRQLRTNEKLYCEVEEEGMLEKLRAMIIFSDGENEHYFNSLGDNDVGVVFRFWKKLIALFSTPSSQCDVRGSIVNVLAGLPWCPELVGRLAIALFPEQVEGKEEVCSCGETQKEATCSLPLHNCIRSFRGCKPRGMLQILCDTYPLAASIPDPSCISRLPLHVALSSGPQHSWEESLSYLFACHPFAITAPDAVTGLPAFCMSCDALAPIKDHQIEQIAKNIGNNRSFCWYYLSRREKARAREEALMLLECRKLTAMYEVLRRDPSVLDTNKTEQR